MAGDQGVLRVLYLEDQESEYRDFSERLRKVLTSVGYADIQFEWARTVAELQSKILDRPHIVFCDNMIGKSKNVGLRSIAEIKGQFPDCVFCLLTSHMIDVETLGAHVPNPEMIISKVYLGSEDYGNALREFFEGGLKRSPVKGVDLSFDLKRYQPRHPRKRTLSQAELWSLVEQCIDTGRETEETGVSSVSLSVVNGGASGAGVYEMRVQRDGKGSKVPAILKISDRKNAIVEYRNYIQYVKWRLPYTWRVDVLGTGFTGEYGAICYSFAAGGGGSPTPVNEYIRAGKFEVIDKVIGTILDSENQTWYAEDRITGKDARDYFASDKFYRTDRQREEFQSQFLEYISENAKACGIATYHDDGNFILNGVKFPRPNKLLFSRNWGLIRECVCHGDMNGGNVIFSGGDTNVVFIDFQRTGYWYLFRDFISFESSTRLEYPVAKAATSPSWWERLGQLMDVETKLYAQEWDCTDLPEYGSHVCRIRQAAHLNFKSEPFEIYVFANLVHCLWLFQKAASWGDEKRLRLAASILAGSEFLQRKACRAA